MKYTVYLTTTASTAIPVEADNKVDAIEAAYEKGMPDVCAQCSGWGKEFGIELGGDWELDSDLDESVIEKE